MNDSDAKVKQQIVEKIKKSTNILVTVSKNPSVDDLSAALGLAALLNKIGKHATAIFSGAIPPAITFLDPSKVFENNVSSLRDFIIALDKEKADHLRYKVEGDVVKIFITPYHTTISGEDLEFSQGDYNVELVLALGVESQESLDMAMAAHGQIIHEVTVATLCAGEQTSRLGSLDWRDESASSLCEMITGIGEALKGDKPILDSQIATALLTGIVASTDRFSNTRTSSRVMTIAAQLMAAGADQQLIAAKLQESHAINALPVSPPASEKVETPVVTDAPAQPLAEQPASIAGTLRIDHESGEGTTDTQTSGTDTSTVVETTAPLDTTPPIDTTPPAPIETKPIDTTPPAEAPVEVSLPQPDTVVCPPCPPTLAPAYAPPEPPKPPEPRQDIVSESSDVVFEPSLGGTLNATAEKAAEDRRKEMEDEQNRTILKHSYLGGSQDQAPTYSQAVNSIDQGEDKTENIDTFAGGPAAGVARTIEAPSTLAPPAPPPPPPPTPTTSTLPDFSTLPPLPPQPDFNVPTSDSGLSTLPTSVPSDPSQFVIPGQ